LNANISPIDFDRMGFLDAILATLPEAVAIIGLDHRVAELNPAGFALLGISSLSELPENAPLSLLSAASVATFVQHFKATVAEDRETRGRTVLMEVHAINGVTRSVECQMAPLKGLHGKIAGVVITARDVSQREANLQTITDSAALLSAILATVPDAMIVIDEKGLITSFSAAAEKMFGYRESEVLGRNVSMLMAQPHSLAHDGYLQRYLDTGERRIIGIGRVVEARRSDGSLFPIELSVGEARTGEHRAFTGFIHDLTDKFEAEARLQEVQAELLHASRLSAAGTLASALAHELNQPLTAIANYVSTGRDLAAEGLQQNSAIIQEALNEASKEALRAGQIIRRMRDFVSKGELETEILPLGKLINDATTLGLLGAREKGVSWSIEIEPGIDQVMADRVQIQQVMVNLMRNAIEAMEGEPQKFLAISARPRGEGMVEILVTDTGHGIPAEMRDQLFLPFISTKARGMGLGLSICRTIVEAHGGHMTVEAGPEGGTMFAFTLPRATQEELHAR
jgi:two-component system, LuxR family, sensor kinase FixL